MDWHSERLRTELEELTEWLETLSREQEHMYQFQDAGNGNDKLFFHYNRDSSKFTVNENIKLVAAEIVKTEKRMSELNRPSSRPLYGYGWSSRDPY
jgi:hypothetical protein